MPVNRRILRMELQKKMPDAILRKAKPLIQARFEESKMDMLMAYDAEEVTQALEGGPDGEDGLTPVGNLFSAVGFEASDQPAAVVRNILETNTRLNLSQTTREVKGMRIVFSTPVRFPSISEVADKAAKVIKLGGWTSRPFVTMIERGFSGLPNYLFDDERNFKTSRSGPAIQIKGNLRGGSFRANKWVSTVLARFRSSISGKR